MKSLLIRGAMLPCAPKTLAHAPRVALGRLALLRRCLSATATSPPVHVDYDSFLSRTATRRRESAIRALMPLMNEPGMISLHGGMPNASTFPFQSCAFALRDGTNLRLSPEELSRSLQYSETPGLPPLVQRLRNLQLSEHTPPPAAADFDIVITTGSQDAIAKAFDVLLNEGDSVLVESPTYTGALACLQGIGAKCVGVGVDEDGLRPDELQRVLESWKPAVQGPKPKVLYTIPTGSNPAGCTQSTERKQANYAICREHDILILEDDPYYYMQFQPTREPSFFSMDVDGRVLRFDSTSKILTPGLRIGWVTGPKALVKRINLNSQATCLHTSGLSQALVLAYLKHIGGLESVSTSGLGAFDSHIDSITEFYRHRRDFAVQSATKHLTDRGLATFTVPQAGMFLWLRLNVPDSAKLIREQAMAAKVLLVPGAPFIPDGSVSSCARASYSMASEDDIDTAFARLGDLLASVSTQ